MQSPYHNLDQIYRQLNKQYFASKIKAHIVWGKHGKRKKRPPRSIRLGSYNSESKKITIHPALNWPWVPRLCLERIVFHEMLHQLYPPKQKRSRCLIHPPLFLQEEKKFIGLHVAEQWIKCNWQKIVTVSQQLSI